MDGHNFDAEGRKALCAAVVEQAVKDYRAALRRHYRKPHDKEVQHRIEECEYFFRWDMGTYSDMDGETIIRKIRNRVIEEMQ